MNKFIKRFPFRRDQSQNDCKNKCDLNVDDFFSFRQYQICGFPNKPSCLAVDNNLGLLAIGTQHGYLHIYGKPGVHFQAFLNKKITHIVFLTGKLHVITLTEDSVMILWKIVTHKESDGSEPITSEPKQEVFEGHLDSKNQPIITQPLKSDNIIQESQTFKANNDSDTTKKDTFSNTEPFLHKVFTKKYDFLKKNTLSSFCIEERCIGSSSSHHEHLTSNGNNNFNKNTLIDCNMDTHSVVAKLYFGMSDGCLYIVDLYNNESYERNKNNSKNSTDDLANYNNDNNNDLKKPYHMLLPDDILENFFSTDIEMYLGSVACIMLHPLFPHKLMVGYSMGVIVSWSLLSYTPESVHNSYQKLEHLSFNHDGSEFISSHSDGSYIIWNTSDSSQPREPAYTPYGPYQCGSIEKFVWKTNESCSLMVFSGGMPKSGYGDRWVVSIMKGGGDEDESHVVLDITSKIIDFLVLDNDFNECLASNAWCSSDKGRTSGENNGKSDVKEGNSKRGANRANKSSKLSYTTPKPSSLVILSEEEVVVVDLQSNEWPSYRLPHLTSPHCSAITSLFHATDVPEDFMAKVREAGRQQEMKSASYSRKTWPFLGGNSVFSNEKDNDLLLSGHEDGTVRFWQTTQEHIQLLYRVCTAHLFGIDVCNHSDALNDSDDDWPPFKKVGSYNPFTDDPRLAIRQVILSTNHKPESLLLAGTAGQVILCEFREATKNSGKLIKEAEPKHLTEDTEEKVKKDKNVLVGDNKTNNNNVESTQIYVGDTNDVKNMDLNDKSDIRLVDGTAIDEKEVEKKEKKVDDELNCHFRTSSSSSSASSSSIKLQVKVSTVNLVNNGDDFLWMGHAPLEVTNHGGSKIRSCPSSASPPVFNPSSLFTPESIAAASSVFFSVPPNDAGFHASSIVLVHPPVSFTALALHAQWNLFAFGSECGFGLFDYSQNTLVFSKTAKIESNKGVSKSNTASTPISSVHHTGTLRGVSNVLRRTWRASVRGLQRARSDLKERGVRGQEVIMRSLSASRCLPGRFKSRTPSNAHTVNNADDRPPSMLNKIKNVLCRPVRGAHNTASNPQPATTLSSKHATLDSANHTYTKPSSSSCSSIYPRTSSEARRGSCEDIFTKASTFERDPKIASLSRLGTPIVRCLYFAENTQLDAADPYNGEAVNTVVTVDKNKTTTAVSNENTANNDTTQVANVSASNNDQPLLIPSNTTLKSGETLAATTASTITAATVISPETCNTTNQNVSDQPNIPASSASFGTFWVGTSRGLLSMFNLVLPPYHLRSSQPVLCSLAKEIQLKQDAPIIDVCLVDKSGQPVEKLFLNKSSNHEEVKNKHKNKKSKFPLSIFSSLLPVSSGQCLIVCSQKQVKVFSYPGLKSKRKVKMSGNGRLQEIRKSPSKGGSNQNTLQNSIVKVAYTNFRHKDDASTTETGLVCMMDDGDACIYSLPLLNMRFYTPGVINKKYFSDLKLCVLTSNGGGYYLCSPSEFQKFSLSATTPYLKTIHLPARSEELARNESEKGTRNIKNSKNSKKSSSDDSHDFNLQKDMMNNNISSGDSQNNTCKIVINANAKNSLVTIENNDENITNGLDVQKGISNNTNNNIIDKESINNNNNNKNNDNTGSSACINDSSSYTNENSYNNTDETSQLNVTTNEYIRSMDEEKLEKIISRFATLDSTSAKFSEPKKHIVLSLPRQPKQPLVSRSSGSSSSSGSVVPSNVVVNNTTTRTNVVDSNNTTNVVNTNVDVHNDTNISHDKELRKACNPNTYIQRQN